MSECPALTVGTLPLQPIRWDMPFYATVNSWDTHTPANQVGHALLRYNQQLGHSHCSQSGGIRTFTLQLTVGTRTLQPIRWGALFYATVNSWDTHTLANQVGYALLHYSQQLGHLRSIQSGGTRPFTLQPTVGTLYSALPSQSASIRPFTLQTTVVKWDSQMRRILHSSQSVRHTNLHFSQSSGTRQLTLLTVI
jgi:hypothetical protein